MPFGVLILGILMLIGGLFSLLWGLGLSGVGGLSWLTGLIFSNSIQSWGGSAFWGGLWSMFVGVLQIVTAFGLFARKHWAWMLALISAGLSMIGPLLGLFNGSFFWSLIGLIIPAAIFFYLLWDKDVKHAFGRA